jgi:hypothetical protein
VKKIFRENKMRKVSIFLILLSFCFLSCAEEEFADDFYEISESFDPSNSTTALISDDENEGQSHEESDANVTKLSSFSSEIDLDGMAIESMAQIYKQLLIDHEGNHTINNSNDKSSEKTNDKSIETITDMTEDIKSFSTSESINFETRDTLQKTRNNTEVMMTSTKEPEEEELNTTSSTTESKQSLIVSNETIEKTENMTTTTLKSTLNQKYSKLLNDSNDDITLPSDFEYGMTTTAKQTTTRTVQTVTSKRQIFAPQFQSPALLPPPPMYPIMPPNIPVNPGYQTIWIPIQVPRDPYSIDQMWKKSRTPTFIERGRLKNRPSIREGTPESWWRRPQPNFCTEPIFVNDYCKDRTPVKRWAFNQADERCYRYVDYCFDDKHNSFDTLQQCLTSCWRATV